MLRAVPLDDLSDELHAASRNTRWQRSRVTAAPVRHDPAILALQSERPLALPGARLPLPPAASPDMALGDAIRSRGSARIYGECPLRSEELGTLLHFANGVREVQQKGTSTFYQRNVPSAGNLGSIEIFALVSRVEGCAAGIYQYDSLEHALIELRSESPASWLREKVLFQPELTAAPVVLVLTCGFQRLKSKYGLRGYRLGLLDAGHVSQNLYLTAAALGLAVCSTGGFVDDELDSELGLDGLDRSSVLAVSIGHR